ncbi:MAG: hypothetical protein II688_08235 [Lachnospiraceae bacterium]|jgi:hypothetical protein|nr:hypothetical protein [Lachnospiraceae bacterium]MBQ3968661.1 hypothetical protein [Lachnospiraceae bacterium]MBR4588183.1 hypothetical protein [Lachnospiraceae bacterium]MCR4928113.1 hypothetical protein [Lachnospiraceae bacterium]
MGLSINISVSDKYAGPVSYDTAVQICGDRLFKMGGEYIGIEDNLTFKIDKVVVSKGRRTQSLIFDMVSAIKMQSAKMEKTKEYKVKQLGKKDGQKEMFTIYKIV